jgi:glycosidase
MRWGDDQDQELHSYYQWLVKLRRDHPVLWRGQRDTVYLDALAGVLAYTRTDEREKLVVVLNASDEPRVMEIGGRTVTLQPWSGTVDPAWG